MKLKIYWSVECSQVAIKFLISNRSLLLSKTLEIKLCFRIGVSHREMRIVLLLVLCGFSVHCWSCGEGKFTEGLAWIIAVPADRQSKCSFSNLNIFIATIAGINKCCVTHDQNYQNFCNGIGSISLETADFLFQRCLENTNNR